MDMKKVEFWMSDMHPGITTEDLRECVLASLDPEKGAIMWHHIAHLLMKYEMRGRREGKEAAKRAWRDVFVGEKPQQEEVKK